MHLSLELGMTVERLEREMTEHELRQWMAYDRLFRLPTRRLERYLAGVMSLLSHSGKPLTDFLLFEREPQAASEPAPKKRREPTKQDVASVKAVLGKGVKVVYLRRKVSNGY